MSDANSVNCWEPVRADMPQHSEQSQVRRNEKLSDSEISSQADAKAPEGSTTRASNLTPIAARLYADGLTTRQIGEKLGAPNNTISRWLRSAGVKMRKVGQRAIHGQLDDKEFLYHQYVTLNKSAEKIAKEHNTWPEGIIRMLKRHGIPVRSTNKGRKFDPEMHRRHAEWLKGRYLGDKNPNWRGGKVDPNMRLRTNYLSKEWSKAVRERDGYKCQDCGKEGGRLHAHHIKSWKEYPDLRWEVSNGVTLCPRCHQKVHGWWFPEWVMENAPRAQGTPSG